MSNMHQLLIGEGLKDGDGFFREIHGNPREMISHHVFETLLVLNLNVELLSEQNPPDEARFSIFFGEKILQCRVIRVDDDFRS
jgi:hypothetical protein